MKPDRARVLTEGLVSGFLGYLGVAVFFAAVNLAAGLPILHTAALLGQAMSGSAVDPAAVTLDPRPILAYNAVHLTLFLAVGIAAAAAILGTERHPNLWMLFFLLFIALLMVSLIGFSVLVGPLAAALPWWSLVGANLTAALAMGAYLVYRHPALLREVEAAEA